MAYEFSPLPTYNPTWSEDFVERMIEHRVDIADKAFMGGLCSQEEYDARIKAIDAWAARR